MRPKHQTQSDSEFLSNFKSSSGFGGISPCGFRRPNKYRWLKPKPQLPPIIPSTGIWAHRKPL